jgi:hypothetical protein
VRNIHPAEKPVAPIGFAGVITGPSRVSLDWIDNEEDDLLGYYVYRSYKPTGGFKRFKIAPLGSSSFVDTTADTTRKIYYRVAAATDDGAVSVFSSTSVLPA